MSLEENDGNLIKQNFVSYSLSAKNTCISELLPHCYRYHTCMGVFSVS